MYGGTDRHYRRTKKVLLPELVLWLPMAPRHVHPTHRLLPGRRRQALPCFPTFYESVYVSSDLLLSRADDGVPQFGLRTLSHVHFSIPFTLRSTRVFATRE
jgi:hypothetical protein